MPSIRHCFRAIAVMAVATAAFGEQITAGNSGADKADSPFAERNPRYRIRATDIVEVSVTPATEFNQTITVQPDGYISLREAGDLHVAGKTLPEMTNLIKKAYGPILHDPVITLTLKDYDKPYFTVGGHVGRPGKYELRADTTVSEGIAIAGGLTDKSKQKQVLVFRRVSDEWAEVKQVDVKALFSGTFREDLHLRSGDMIFVPQSRLSKLKPYLPIWSLGTYLGVNPRF